MEFNGVHFLKFIPSTFVMFKEILSPAYMRLPIWQTNKAIAQSVG